ncbi:MAG: methylmalonyl-CoA mutase [Deltaproteobacteria bacterium]|jgi:methylmalonyl-CoA mutase C-terminal domain/subunit|nr:MAG: methylmalonyl-CoA mutase [Deltaproteobacteria bacterium]
MKDSNRKIKVVVAMPGLDCHDRGIIYLSHVLKEAGMEVVYLGKFNTPEYIVNTAMEEDADVIALSYLNDHLYMIFFPRVIELLKEKGCSDICVMAGGRIIEEDRPKLLELGITGFFGQSTPTKDMIQHIEDRVKRERWKQ